jgi:hypothetical protein
LLFPGSSHEDIKYLAEIKDKMCVLPVGTPRSAEHLVGIDGYDHYSLWLCQDFSELSVVNGDNRGGRLFLAIGNLCLEVVGTCD